MRLRTFAAYVCLVAMLPIVGCGTLFTPKSLDIDISSNPSGAKVFIDNMPMGSTPVSYKIKPYDQQRIRIEADGYDIYEGRIDSTLNAVTLINLLFWPAFIVDLITGNFFAGKDINATLYPSDGKSPHGGPSRSTATTAPRAIAIEVPDVERRNRNANEPIRPGARYQRLTAAVLPVVPKQNASPDDAAVLGNFLEPAIFSRGEYVYDLTDRTVVEQTIQELGFQQSDFTDKTAAARLGEILNVNHLIVGIYTQSGDGSVNSLSVRIIEVSTNRLLALKTRSARDVEDAGNQMPALVDELLREMLDRSGHPAVN